MAEIEKSPLAHVISQHFRSLQDQRMEVPEWADESGRPAVVCFSPLTLEERDRLDGYSGAEFLARVLIMKARGEDGKPLFTVADLQMLRHSASPAVVARIANRIVNADLVDPSKLEKHSGSE